jgi:tetratricopeptide (TPR) repeat protein
MMVNGEKYGEAMLSNGDTLTLGHVRMKFLMPGARFSMVPDQVAGKGIGLMGAALLLLISMAGGAGLAVYKRPELLQKLPPGLPLPTWLVSRMGQEPPVAAVAQRADPLKSAHLALDARDFDAALRFLSQTPRSSAEEASKLGLKVKHELAVKRVLSDAADATAQRRFGLAHSLLDGLRSEYQNEQQMAALAKLKAAEDEKAAPAQGEPAEPGAGTVAAAAADAPHLFELSKALIAGEEYTQATVYLERCLKADPSYLHCEAFLGAAYSYMKQEEPGLLHYKSFLEHAPKDDPTYAAELDQVRKILERYQAELAKTPKAAPRRGAGRPL